MVKLYYRRVYFKGYETIPNGKPAIFASNHPAAFMEPIILGSSVRDPLSFLTLATYIANRWLKWFYSSLKMVPIYRTDIVGRESIQKNEGTFQYVYESLKSNAHILIFPEASTSFVYTLRPLKKGIARMSVGFMNKNPEKEMYIVPVGVNFIHPSRFRSDVFVHVGEPVDLKSMESDDEAVMINQFVKATYDGMEKVVYDIADEQRHATASYCISMINEQFGGKRRVFGKIWRHHAEHVQRMKDFTVRLNRMEDDVYDILENKVNTYRKLLKDKKLSDYLVGMNGFSFVKTATIVLTGFPFFLGALILNSIHLLYSWYVRKNAIERQEFQAPVTIAIAAIFILIGSLVFLILGIVLNPWWLLLFAALPLSLVFGVFYYDHLDHFIKRIRWNLLDRSGKDNIKSLRSEIMSVIQS